MEWNFQKWLSRLNHHFNCFRGNQNSVVRKLSVKKSINSPSIFQVRIGVHCSAVNAPDRLLTQGLSEDKVKLPFIPGFEVAGEILERHDKSNNEDEDDDDVLEVGDRVLALSKEDFGGFSEECIVSEKVLTIIYLLYSFKKYFLQIVSTLTYGTYQQNTFWWGCLIRRLSLSLQFNHFYLCLLKLDLKSFGFIVIRLAMRWVGCKSEYLN